MSRLDPAMVALARRTAQSFRRTVVADRALSLMGPARQDLLAVPWRYRNRSENRRIIAFGAVALGNEWVSL